MKKHINLIAVFLIIIMTLSACSGKLPFVPTEAQTQKETEKPSGSSIIPEKTTEAATDKQEPQTQGTDPAVQTTEAPTTLELLQVDPIQETRLTVAHFELKEYRAASAEIITYTGSLSGSKEDVYKLKAEEDGLYHLWLTNLKSGFTVSIFVYDQNDYLVNQNYGTSNGNGISCELQKGITYKIVLSAYDGSGNYTLNIGTQKKTEDLSGYTVLQESIQFEDQQINYKYVPAESGVYRFWLSQIKSDFTVSEFLYDDLGYLLTQNYGLSKDGGIEYQLEKGKTYQLRLEEYSELGSFTMNVGIQKPVTQVAGSGYTVITDSMQFEKQENLYSFSPAVSGSYHFEISQIKSDSSVTIMIYDADGYLVGCLYGLQSGEFLDQELEANKNYLVKAVQYYGLDEYTMVIGCPKDTVKIDGTQYGGVLDSIQYQSQYNRYEYVPESSGTYQFQVVDVAKDMTVTLRILDKDGNVLNNYYGMGNGDTQEIELQQGVTFCFDIVQREGLGDYSIGFLKVK